MDSEQNEKNANKKSNGSNLGLYLILGFFTAAFFGMIVYQVISK